MSAASLVAVFLALPWILAACSGSGTTDSSKVIDIGDNNPGVVLAAGDSVTWGTDSPGNRGYRDELKRFLGEQGKAVTVINGGRASARSFHIDETNAELWRT